MTQRLAGRTAFITAAAQGIGRAIAMAYLNEGACVVASDVAADRLDAGFGATAAACHVLDVTDETAVLAAAAAHPDVDILVNCAGWVAPGSVLDLGAEDFTRCWRLNVLAMATTIRAFLPAMQVRRRGAIVNIASVVSTEMVIPNRCAYATTKAAVVGLTKSVALDFVADGITCNAISPGTIDTPSLRQRMAATGDADAAHAAFLKLLPVGRLGLAEEVAAVAVLLASDEARFMTGSNIVIDGGMSL